MKHDGLATSGVHIPVPLSPEEDLLERRIELINLFSGTNVTASDRATETYTRLASFVGPSTEWESREDYLARCYLTAQADDLLIRAINTGVAPVVADIPGRGHARLDHRIFFGLNKWWPQDTIGSARYKPMNEGCDAVAGKERAAASGFPLWIRSEDWDDAVDQIVHMREEIAREAFPQDRLALRRMFRPAIETFVDLSPGQETSIDGHYWSLYEAIAWLGSQDEALVAQQQLQHFASTDPKHYGAVAWMKLKRALAGSENARAGHITADAARSRLLIACECGDVRSNAIPAYKGARRSVPAAEYVGSQIWEGRGGSIHRLIAGVSEAARWYDVRFHADDVRALTEAPRRKPEATSTPSVPARKTPVSTRELRNWVEARNVEGWSQDQIVKGAAIAFPENEVPGRPTLRGVDADVRAKLEYPPRKKGRGKKGE